MNTSKLPLARKLCQEIDAKYQAQLRTVPWTEIFADEEEIYTALSQIEIPRNRTAPPYTFNGYAYIYSFAYYVQRGWKLSDKQLAQCKRLALEIKKAHEISRIN